MNFSICFAYIYVYILQQFYVFNNAKRKFCRITPPLPPLNIQLINAACLANADGNP